MKVRLLLTRGPGGQISCEMAFTPWQMDSMSEQWVDRLVGERAEVASTDPLADTALGVVCVDIPAEEIEAAFKRGALK